MNSPAVVSERIDDEIIVIHCETGTYFVVNGSGTAVWEALDRGATIADCALLLSTRHGVDHTDVVAVLTPFFDQLLDEGLVIETDEPGASLAALDGHGDEQYVPPKLEPYLDMQTLIQLDPILEVDDAGWPHSESG